MILYVDTSALVKKYIVEEGSDKVISFFNQNLVIGTTAITQVEMAAALSKAIRLGWVDEDQGSQAWRDFLSHWPAYTRLPVTTGLVERAVSLAWSHNLRAYDAVHLASALTWGELIGEPVNFACFDKGLLKAAQKEGLTVWPEGAGEG